jgi:tyrosine-protein kinase Etk/Wzc
MNNQNLPAPMPAPTGALMAAASFMPSMSPLPFSSVDATPWSQFLRTLYRGRWLVIGSTAVCLLAGAAYVTLTRPVYRSDLLIQVEPVPSDLKQTSGDAPSSATSNQPNSVQASSEIEVLRSRMVMSNAVDHLRLYIDAVPKYAPVVGWWLANHLRSVSTPLPGGYVYGTERIDVPVFDVPTALEDKPFTLTLEDDGLYTLKYAPRFGSDGVELHGRVGTLLNAETSAGPLQLMVAGVSGKPGASFTLTRHPKVGATETLQKHVMVSERGKDSNIIGVTLDGTNALLISSILNEIGRAYVDQNVRRRSEAADKTIRFLDEQLPQRKARLEQAESRYNAFRQAHGTISTSEEGLSLLQQTAATQTRIVELKQHREDLLTRYTEDHPAIKAIDGELREAQSALGSINSRMRALPMIEQNVLQLQRDMQAESSIYTTLLNTRQQLALVRAAKVANVRILDQATPALLPIQPRAATVIAGSTIAGLVIGVVLACMRRRMKTVVETPQDVEFDAGLPLFATVLHSRLKVDAMRDVPQGAKLVLAPAHPRNEASVESLRSFRTTLQFALASAANRTVLITGPTARVGKSYLSSNLAMLSGAANKRVLLIDADLRKGLLHQYFGVPRGPGLTDAIAGTHPFEEAVHRGVAPGVDLLSVGSPVVSPSETLLRPELAALIKSLDEQYDMVVIDGPPLLVADALVLGRSAGTVLLVARHGQSTATEIRESARRLGLANVPVRGVVFNDFAPGPGNYSYPYWGDGYFSDNSVEATGT